MKGERAVFAVVVVAIIALVSLQAYSSYRVGVADARVAVADSITQAKIEEAAILRADRLAEQRRDSIEHAELVDSARVRQERADAFARRARQLEATVAASRARVDSIAGVLVEGLTEPQAIQLREILAAHEESDAAKDQRIADLEAKDADSQETIASLWASRESMAELYAAAVEELTVTQVALSQSQAANNARDGVIRGLKVRSWGERLIAVGAIACALRC